MNTRSLSSSAPTSRRPRERTRGTRGHRGLSCGRLPGLGLVPSRDLSPYFVREGGWAPSICDHGLPHPRVACVVFSTFPAQPSREATLSGMNRACTPSVCRVPAGPALPELRVAPPALPGPGSGWPPSTPSHKHRAERFRGSVGGAGLRLLCCLVVYGPLLTQGTGQKVTSGRLSPWMRDSPQGPAWPCSCPAKLACVWRRAGRSRCESRRRGSSWAPRLSSLQTHTRASANSVFQLFPF